MQYSNAYKKRGVFFKSAPPYTEMPSRRIITNLPDMDVADNAIKTSKYTVLSFVPLNLLVQFSKLPNLYFLIIGIMQMIPQISVSGGFPVIFIPLTFVVAVSAAKDFFEDQKRKASDREINESQAQRLGADGWKEVAWARVRIGDVIRVQSGQQFPADVILLQSAEEDLSCFIETKNLDGETNLKHKQVKFQLGKQLRGIDSAALFALRQEFNYQRPNPFIYSFTGSWNGVILDCNNIVLRGCCLKITRWVTGVVIYSGVDSKIMLNSNKTRQKKSRLEFKMGLIVIGIFFAQMALTFGAALISTLTINAVVLEYGRLVSMSRELFVKWGSWVLLFTNFVPISLIVTLEMVKYIQGSRIASDDYFTTAPHEVRVQTSSLNEELGQIQHVFTDKTGTLTRNYMSFKHMVIAEETFGYDSVKTPLPANVTNVDFHDQQFFRRLATDPPAEGSDTFEMLVALGLCHGVILEEGAGGERRFNASSPDELAFINMARLCGWEYIGVNSENQRVLRTPQGELKYRILHTIQFDSDRKRMSVILQRNGRIFVYCKGADNIIMARLRSTNTKRCKTAAQRIEEWSQEGLRTLVFARREVELRDYEKWAKMYASSLSKLEKKEKTEKEKRKREVEARLAAMEKEENRASKYDFEGVAKLLIEDQTLPSTLLTESPEILMHRLLNDNALLTQGQKQFIAQHLDIHGQQCTSTSKEIQQILECQFQLIGATAIQDQLQDNVKGTIEAIRRAGVKVWMLTGDKKETAINIGISCGLVAPDMAVLEWKGSVEHTLEEREQLGAVRECCLVATGESLLAPVQEKQLLRLVSSCQAVICCRVTPKQKQDMVWLMRKNKTTTLAIGDGANDVNMINTAHVGIGIKGVEGAQAALCSDYAISEFQILRQLMLYHGRECYRKNARLILFNFYKNLLLVLPQLWFGFQNHFSSATIYDPWVYQLYNVAFTSFPIIVFAVFDQQHSKQASLKEPQLYQLGLKNQLFNFKAIAGELALPVVYAAILSFVTYMALGNALDSSGHMADMMSCGMAIFAECVIIANLKVLILAYLPSPGLKILAVLGVLFFYGCSLLEQSLFPFGDMGNALSMQLKSANYWAVVSSCVGLVVMAEAITGRYEALLQVEKEREVQFEEIELPLLGEKKPLIEL